MLKSAVNFLKKKEACDLITQALFFMLFNRLARRFHSSLPNG